jgi:uncharacterized protein (DUF2236 family)
LKKNATYPNTSRAKKSIFFSKKSPFRRQIHNLRVLVSMPVPPPHHGYFGPDSMSWRLYREPWVFVGGFRALLLQIAHPAVAEGVARYSNFRADALGRGYRTFAAMATIYFGTQAQADEVAAHLRRIHGRMPIEPSPEGVTHHAWVGSASAPSLQLWVWATLIDTTFRVFEPAAAALHLPADWQAQFYAESRVAARVLGIPDSLIPPDLTAFEAYFQSILGQNNLLGLSPTSAELTAGIVEHRLVIRSVGQLLALGWLPNALCQRLGIAVKPDSRQRFGRLLRRWLWVYRLLPRGLRYAPAWHQAQGRIRRTEGRRVGFFQRMFCALGRRWQVPLGIRV